MAQETADAAGDTTAALVQTSNSIWLVDKSAIQIHKYKLTITQYLTSK